VRPDEGSQSSALKVLVGHLQRLNASRVETPTQREV
jgi:hypothetical protein